MTPAQADKIIELLEALYEQQKALLAVAEKIQRHLDLSQAA